jgi:hypothetical protein
VHEARLLAAIGMIGCGRHWFPLAWLADMHERILFIFSPAHAVSDTSIIPMIPTHYASFLSLLSFHHGSRLRHAAWLI